MRMRVRGDGECVLVVLCGAFLCCAQQCFLAIAAARSTTVNSRGVGQPHRRHLHLLLIILCFVVDQSMKVHRENGGRMSENVAMNGGKSGASKMENGGFIGSFEEHKMTRGCMGGSGLIRKDCLGQ